MAKTAKRRPSPTTAAARAAFTVPVPKGPNPGAIPGRGRFRPPVADEEEEAAFASTAGRSGQRGRASNEALTAARMRASGGMVDDDDVPPVRGFLEDQPQDGDSYEDADDAGVDDKEFEPPQPPAPQSRVRAPKPLAPVIPQVQAPATWTPFAMPTPPQPQHDPRRVTSATMPDLEARVLAAEDVDRLWDWIRGDEDGGQHFLGMQFPTSLALHAVIRQISGESERAGLSILRSLFWRQQHFGFLMLAPILARERTALCHIYLRHDARGGLAQLVHPLVSIAEQLAPNIHLAVYSPDESWERLHKQVLAPLGFSKHAMFIR